MTRALASMMNRFSARKECLGCDYKSYAKLQIFQRKHKPKTTAGFMPENEQVMDPSNINIQAQQMLVSF